MSDLDLIPPYLHAKVAGMTSPEYDGKLAAALEADERVELATMGRINTRHISDKAGRGKPALLAVTNQRVMAVLPRRKGPFGKKDPEPISIGFGNVFESRVHIHDTSEVFVEICGPAPRGMKGAYIIWKLATGDPNDGDIWAVTIKDGAVAAGGIHNRPNGA